MAKSNHRSVDKVERGARLANVQRQRQIEERELRNLNRMGWMEDAEGQDEYGEEMWDDEVDVK